MDVAKLVLEYVTVLVWPLLIGIALIWFRTSIHVLAGRVSRIGFGDMSLEFAAKLDELAQTIATETNMPANNGVLDETFLRGIFANARSIVDTSPEAAHKTAWDCFQLVVDKAEPALNVRKLRMAVSASGPWFRASPELVARGLPVNVSASIAGLVELHGFAQVIARSPRARDHVASLIDAAEAVTMALNAAIPQLQPGELLYDAATLTVVP